MFILAQFAYKETLMNEAPPIVLCFSNNDPSGGAGLSGDILTLASLGCHALPVMTAVTTQDSTGIEDMMAIDADWVSDQARFILEDMPVMAFKVGMLGSVENLAVVAEIAADYPDIPLVLDPVFTSGDSNHLFADEFVAAMRELLLPYTRIVIANRQEAYMLAVDDPDEENGLGPDEYVHRILMRECEYVLLTGTHENTPQIVNTLYDRSGAILSLEWDRLTQRYHGKGCTLSAAIAGALVNGLSLVDAVKEAQEYTWQSLFHAYRAGMGKNIPDRLFWARQAFVQKEDDAA